ncbi:class II glutamine amidotransferase [Marinicella sp. W31]|uniref:class II glutamine amidotransferase n=1 Tax=Marinicella sp. W31 TaxID=3023713 RepID=UPI003756ECEA
MCRWLAYQGPPIFLEDLIIKPSRSLLVQSRFARENFVEGMPGIPDGAFPTNGDGFGIAWYGEREQPGLYRDLKPAWSDRNLINLSAQIKSGLFMAHLRAAYYGIVQRTNSHPFRYRNWVFQHNGEISGFEIIKQKLQCLLPSQYFAAIQGSTDTETAFYLALAHGLQENPKQAMLEMVRIVESQQQQHGIEEPFRLTCAFSDGETLYAVRYATDNKPKTLYYNKSQDGLDEIIEGQTIGDGTVLLSEPLDECSGYWCEVPNASFVTVHDNNISISDFNPN